VARNIRACPRGHDTMLVALTGWGQEKDRRQTHATGFDHHLVKPAEVEALRAVLATMQ
jgi:CheY-like chemotaxis protein